MRRVGCTTVRRFHGCALDGRLHDGPRSAASAVVRSTVGCMTVHWFAVRYLCGGALDGRLHGGPLVRGSVVCGGALGGRLLTVARREPCRFGGCVASRWFGV